MIVCVCLYVCKVERGRGESERGTERDTHREGAGLQSDSLRRADLSRRCGQTLEIPSLFCFLSVQDKTDFPPRLDGELLNRGDWFPGIFYIISWPSRHSTLSIVS